MTIAEKITRAKADIDAVYEAGKQAQYDEFWDAFFSFVELSSNFNSAFAGRGWNKSTFRPTQSMKPRIAERMFYETYNLNIDLVEHLAECGASIDFSMAKNMTDTFFNSAITRVGVIDLSSAESTSLALANNAIHTIDKLIVTDKIKFDRMFKYSYFLENITIEGTIGQNGFDVSWSTKLSKASIISIINALSATTSGLSVTLSNTAVNNAFETSAGAGDGSTSAEWQSLIAPKSNWTISLI